MENTLQTIAKAFDAIDQKYEVVTYEYGGGTIYNPRVTVEALKVKGTRDTYIRTKINKGLIAMSTEKDKFIKAVVSAKGSYLGKWEFANKLNLSGKPGRVYSTQGGFDMRVEEAEKCVYIYVKPNGGYNGQN
jgi:hypothetical protein